MTAIMFFFLVVLINMHSNDIVVRMKQSDRKKLNDVCVCYRIRLSNSNDIDLFNCSRSFVKENRNHCQLCLLIEPV